MMRTKLIEIFPDWTGIENKYAIFKTLYDIDTSEKFPFLEQYARLDAEYIANISGSKSVSPIVERLIAGNTTKELTAEQRIILANIILNRFGTKWTKLYSLLSMEYNPIENYSMTETETPDLHHKHTVSDDYELKDETSRSVNIETENVATDDFEITDEDKKKFTITDSDSVSTDYEESESISHGKSSTESSGVSDDYKKIEKISKNVEITESETASADYEVTESRETGTDTTVLTTADTNSQVYGFNSNSPIPNTNGFSNGSVHTTGSPTSNTDEVVKTQTGGLTKTTSADEDDNTETHEITQIGGESRVVTDSGTDKTTRTQTGEKIHTSSGSDEDNVETSRRTQTGGTVTTQIAEADENKETSLHTQSGFSEDIDSGTRTLTRSGNIGVTTSQQMAQSEIDLWQWNFVESIYKDVDSVLTLSIYEL